MQTSTLLIGMNDRLFMTNRRPILEDIAFAAAHDLRAIQFHGTTAGLGSAELGEEPAVVGLALQTAGVAAVMEILIYVTGDGRHESGATLMHILAANLPAIHDLGCIHVHWHLALRERLEQSAIDQLEQRIVPDCIAAVELARTNGFRFAIEHNEPAVRPFYSPERMAALLEAVPGLGLVWDLNHAAPDQVAGYLALTQRITMLHVADTPLPEINYHLPLGLGTIDFRYYLGELLRRGFSGPAILEIGGLPKSGGYGRDSDDALISSRARLLAAIA